MLISVIQISPQNVYAAKKIKLSKTKVILYVGENYCLDLYDGKSQVLDLKWKSSNKNVAKVNEIGNIKALKKGKAKITVKYKNKKYVCNVIVKDALKNHVSYELIDIPENAYSGQYNKMIKIVNNNDVMSTLSARPTIRRTSSAIMRRSRRTSILQRVFSPLSVPTRASTSAAPAGASILRRSLRRQVCR